MNPGPSDPNQPPPLPPRSFDNSGHMGMTPGTTGMGYGGLGGGMYGNGLYGGGYSGLNNGLYGGGMYGGGLYGGGMYGGGMYGGGMYGHNESNFSRLAEESSRGAFQSIESVVNAVTSVANMLSSTHNAVYSSFRAVIGVVEQFGRLKMQLTSVVVSLSIFKFAYKLWRYLLVLLRLKPANYASAAELAWGDAKEPYGSDVLGSSNGVNWPTLLFWAVALGGPYLIYKCIDQMVKSVEEKRKWAIGSGNHYTAQTLYNFQANSDQELSFMSGETLRVAPKEEQPRVRGWLLASTQDGTKIGLVPINYVKIVGRPSQSPPLRQPIDNWARFEKALPATQVIEK